MISYCESNSHWHATFKVAAGVEQLVFLTG